MSYIENLKTVTNLIKHPPLMNDVLDYIGSENVCLNTHDSDNNIIASYKGYDIIVHESDDAYEVVNIVTSTLLQHQLEHTNVLFHIVSHDGILSNRLLRDKLNFFNSINNNKYDEYCPVSPILKRSYNTTAYEKETPRIMGDGWNFHITCYFDPNRKIFKFNNKIYYVELNKNNEIEEFYCM